MNSRILKLFIIFSLTVSLFLNTGFTFGKGFTYDSGFTFSALQQSLPEVFPTEQDAYPFRDGRGHHAEAAIAEMYAKGAMRGYNDGTFRPKRPVTFLEAEVMLDKLLWGKPIKTDLTYNEYLHLQFGIPAWAVGYIASALRNNILMYNELQEAARQQPLTREDAAVLAVRALELTNQVKRKQNAPLPFEDASQISEKARGYVVIAWEQKIFSGFAGKFHPADPISRAEMAIVLSRLVQQIPSLQSDEVSGFIKSVNPLTSTVTLTGLNVQETRIKLPEQSLYYLNDKPSSFAELTAGNNIRIISSDSGPTTVVISQFVTPDAGTDLRVKPIKPSSASADVQQWIEENKVSENYLLREFGDSLYFLVTRGEKMHSGFSVEIARISSTEDEKGLHLRVWVEKSDPPRGAIVSPVISYPMSLVRTALPVKPVADVTFVNKLNQEITIIEPKPAAKK